MSNKLLVEELSKRGFINQHTADLSKIFPDDETKRVAYLGVDPTASSIHVGNLVTYMMAEHLMHHGHSVVLLVGGGTGLIGDPSGKDNERDFASDELVKNRTERIASQLASISGLSQMKIVNNYDWLSKINLISYLRDFGKLITVNSMMKRESVARRLEREQGISYAEFSYAMLQAIDYHYLYCNYQCDLQLGGSDQWGNIVSGVELIRKKEEAEVFGLTLPLIVDKSTGKKFGKSEGNAIWLDPEKTSYYHFYQFWINTTDESVIDYLRLFTFLSLDEIDRIEKQHSEAPHLRNAQIMLAYEVTKFVHGEDIANAVKQVTEIIFGSNSLEKILDKDLQLLEKYAPISEINGEESILDIIVDQKLASSRGDGRKLILGGAIRVNGAPVKKDSPMFKSSGDEKIVMISRGKKNKVILKIMENR